MGASCSEEGYHQRVALADVTACKVVDEMFDGIDIHGTSDGMQRRVWQD